ncbi:helix-turn-helix domain-containing protein [Chryseobacterium sp. JUb7]|uniref:helix-turn-helix domain-containing protein n=1 Tax=Chryseobacterium sp. JUb7 TaxID=2940599 RepID=UPI00216A33AB|nr:helix-turn-helix domain-containing protein [Chryseobacterium sp. JUb7]MCS3532994.1 AraC-like DNA-binding protein [Chryseobacterium sp. JUb7]
MSKSLLGFVIFIITTVNIPAQKKLGFDELYETTIAEKFQKNYPAALKKADSLYKSSRQPLDKIKSLMLSANLYQQIGDFKKSICYAENANSLIDEADDMEWSSQVAWFLAVQYRLVALFERSKKYTLKSFEFARKIKDPQQQHKIEGLLNQELAYYEIQSGSPQRAIDYINASLVFFEKADTQDYKLLTAASNQILGDIYFRLNHYETAEGYYKKSEALIEQPSRILALNYNGLGGIRLKQKQWSDAQFYLNKAEDIAEKFIGHLDLKKAIYANINDYYEATDDSEKASIYTRKYMKAYDDLNAKSKILNPQNIDDQDKFHERIVEMSVAKNVTIIILCSGIIGLLIFFRRKQKKQHSKFKSIIRSQQILSDPKNDTAKPKSDHDFSNISVEEVDDRNQDVKKRNESLMTSETETKLLEHLNEFEKGALYNNKNMSLPFLAGELNTNTKYLSYVINQHKSSDFKTYINRLRINYIVDKLINDEKYRQYKISILADECGFSSHSKFASVFKAVTDFSPSAYIKHLDSENQTDKNVHFQENN